MPVCAQAPWPRQTLMPVHQSLKDQTFNRSPGAFSHPLAIRQALESEVRTFESVFYGLVSAYRLC